MGEQPPVFGQVLGKSPVCDHCPATQGAICLGGVAYPTVACIPDLKEFGRVINEYPATGAQKQQAGQRKPCHRHRVVPGQYPALRNKTAPEACVSACLADAQELSTRGSGMCALVHQSAVRCARNRLPDARCQSILQALLQRSGWSKYLGRPPPIIPPLQPGKPEGAASRARPSNFAGQVIDGHSDHCSDVGWLAAGRLGFLVSAATKSCSGFAEAGPISACMDSIYVSCSVLMKVCGYNEISRQRRGTWCETLAIR